MARTAPDTAHRTNAGLLLKPADAARGRMDAAEYEHVALGLLFPRHISDSFDARRDGLGELVELEACPSEGERPMVVACERSKGVADAG